MMIESPLVAGLITLRAATELPAEKVCAPHFRLWAIASCRYPNVYKAWRNHHHRNTNIYNGLYSTPKIRKWNRHMDQVRKNLESVLPVHQFLFSCLFYRK